jgi:succinoglycan biosynthesis transport protein ExoP
MMEELDDQKSIQGIDDYWAIVRRRKWWIIGPLFLGWLIVFVSAWLIPAKYASESVILVEPPKVPKDLVAPNVEVDLADRVQSMSTQVLSRTRLLSLIEKYKLYPSNPVKTFIFGDSPDDQVRSMRDDIKMDMVQAPAANGKLDLVAFKISYQAPSPAVAQQVNAALSSFFVDENVRASQEQSAATTQFLDSQAKQVAQALADQEAKVRAFEAQHEGALPQELQSNIQILQGIQNQLQSAAAAREHALQQQAYLNSQLQQYQSMGTAEGSAPPSVDQQLETARAQLADLRSRYTDDHPDVKKLKDSIAGLEKLKKDMGAEAKQDIESSAATPAQVQSLSPLMHVQSELKANKLELQSIDSQIQHLQAQGQEYQNRLNQTSAVETEMTDLMRGYQQSKEDYAKLLAKKSSSALATTLEREQQGEQFRVIDPPSFPDKASFPDRFRFSLAGLAMGLGLAVLFGAGSEVLDDRIRSEQELNDAVSLPVLVEIPSLPTESEIRAARWQPRLAITATVLVMLLIPAGIAYAYFWG